MDIWCDHALVCSCKGDRTLRHNSIRDLVFRSALATDLRPQKEKPNLPPLRPDAETIRETTLRGRRPADVWVPSWRGSGPAAFDFAVTSGMQSSALHRSAVDGTEAALKYEQVKREFQNTADTCQQNGLQFLPLVLEAHGGGMGPTAKATLKASARQAAAQTGQPTSQASQELMQRISIALQRENARSVLRRLSQDPACDASANSRAWMKIDDEKAEDVAQMECVSIPGDGPGPAARDIRLAARN